MFCSQCGTAIVETDRFCRACGRDLGTVPPPPTPPDSPLIRRPGLVTLLAVLHFIGGGVMLLMTALMALGLEKDPVPSAVIGGICALLTVLHLACAFGLLKLRPWGRILQIGLSIVGLLAIPLGTVISILILVYMFRPGVVLLFSGRKPEEFTPAEAQVLRTQGGGESGATVAVVVVAGLFLFIMFAGIVAAIAIPNLINAIQRGKQKRTIADMKTVAAAVEAYAVDNNAYPDAGTIDELAGILEPVYIRTMPRTDGWARPLKYEAWLENEDDEVPTTYALGSAGKDGAWERQDLVDTPEGRTTSYDADIVLINGAFVQWPEGTDPPQLEKRTDVPPETPAEEEPPGPVLHSGLPPHGAEAPA